RRPHEHSFGVTPVPAAGSERSWLLVDCFQQPVLPRLVPPDSPAIMGPGMSDELLGLAFDVYVRSVLFDPPFAHLRRDHERVRDRHFGTASPAAPPGRGGRGGCLYCL